MKIGMCGTGAFANSFIPLFKAHPLVEKVILSDLDAEKLAEKSKRFDIPDTLPSLDALCDSDVDAVAIITQPERHGKQAIQAMKAGKHVYSAVPSAASVEELRELIETVKETKRVYMIGETSYYYPCTVYCRKRFEEGAFGHVVYSEAEYYHDYDHGLYDVVKWRHGKDWRLHANKPPLYYPTHSVSMVVSVTGAHVTHVSAMGYVDRHEDGLFASGAGRYDNSFSNETMLCRMSDGSMARFNEFRRVGHPGTVGMSMYGTEGSYEEQVAGKSWATKERDGHVDLNDLLRCQSIPAADAAAAGNGDPMSKVTSADGTHQSVSRIHDIRALPKEYIGLPNGHNGSHQFLVNDFITSCADGTLPPNHAWAAARYLIPGLIGHESARQGGVLLEVPDFGDAPAR